MTERENKFQDCDCVSIKNLFVLWVTMMIIKIFLLVQSVAL